MITRIARIITVAGAVLMAFSGLLALGDGQSAAIGVLLLIIAASNFIVLWSRRVPALFQSKAVQTVAETYQDIEFPDQPRAPSPDWKGFARTVERTKR